VAWIVARLVDRNSAASAIRYVAPVGEQEAAVIHGMSIVTTFIQ
jgi:hypothetical protein